MSLLLVLSLLGGSAALEQPRRPSLSPVRRTLLPPPEPLAAAPAAPSPWWHEPWRQHDAFNLAVLPVAIALTGAALVDARWQLPLTRFFSSYIAVDMLWLMVKPSMVRAPCVLIGHHLVTLLLLAHALLHPAHARYVAWMSVVEVNTFFLILRRHLKGSALVDASFIATWIGIRVLW